MFASNTLIFSASRGSGGSFTPPPVDPSGASLTVTWEDNSAIETGFHVRYRPAGSGAYTLATTTAANVETAIITGIDYGTSYDVTVAAFNGSGEYSQVGPITRYTPPEFAPTDLTADTITATTVEINFTPAAGVTKYQGHYRPGTSGAWLTGPSITSGTSINFTGLAAGTTYHVKIAGYITNPDIEAVTQTPSYSPDSDPISVTTGAAQVFFSGYDNQQFTTGVAPAGYSFVEYGDSSPFVEWGGGSYSPNCYFQGNTGRCRVVAPVHAAHDEVHYKFIFQQSENSGYSSMLYVPGICSVIIVGSTLQMESHVDATGWGGGGTVFGAAAFNAAAVNHVWFDYIKGTGAGDTLMRISWNASDSKPTVFTSANSITYMSNHSAQATGLVFHVAPTTRNSVTSIVGSTQPV